MDVRAVRWEGALCHASPSSLSVSFRAPPVDDDDAAFARRLRHASSPRHLLRDPAVFVGCGPSPSLSAPPQGGELMPARKPRPLEGQALVPTALVERLGSRAEVPVQDTTAAEHCQEAVLLGPSSLPVATDPLAEDQTKAHQMQDSLFQGRQAATWQLHHPRPSQQRFLCCSRLQRAQPSSSSSRCGR